ncbi:hypothetical protein N7510_011544 [Penicillium lagena]|uniref:uncharacterized protein n=1 Tax=Penicillium lagena TaxID=94218 RepID=UPI00253FFF7B|nr:uncharacterized protein N7510_011544 [Penicillium lagena]KAJ5602010.1 hypothetical protein N7510_011544 [Penicillium lagena]
MPNSTPPLAVDAAAPEEMDEDANWSAKDGTAENVGTTRRSPKACEMCYRRKTRCEVDGSNPVCLQCMRRSTKCFFPSRKEKRAGLKRKQYVRSLKERLGRLESLLKTAGILDENAMSEELSDDDDDDPADEDSEAEAMQPEEPPRSTGATMVLGKPSPGTGVLGHAFKCDVRDDSRYFGRASSLSILSPQGIEWIKRKTGDVSFLKVLFSDSARDTPWNHWRPDVFHDLFASKVFKPLPSRSEVFSLMKDFFRTANRLFPIYHEETFMRMVEWQYTQQTCDDAARWASINIILSLSYEYRLSNSMKPEKDREKAWLYFKNAVSVFTELTLRRTDLLSVQALLGMAFFLRGNSGTQSALPIVTAAMRSCQRMGLHRDIPRPELPAAEQEQRKRVFWIAFILDQSTCLRAGTAPSQHPDDFDVALPADAIGNEDTLVSNNIPFFRQLCRLTIIKSRIYSQLYSTKALQRPPKEVYRTVKELHTELEEWRRQHPLLKEPKQKVAESDFLYGFASVGLHFVYYNALIMVHRIPLLMNYAYSSRLPNASGKKQAMSAQASSSAVICVQAARDTLKLVNNMPWGDIAWIWSLLYYVFLAVATIFSNTIRDHDHPHAREDLQSLNMAATFFATLIPGDGPSNYAGFMTRMSANLERIARMVVEKDERIARDLESKDKERRAPGSRRQNSRTSLAPSSRSRHRSTTTRTSTTTPGTAAVHQQAMPRMPSASTTTGPYMPDISIPETVEGLPPVNSCGYVVPMSPGDTSQDPTCHTNSTTTLDHGDFSTGTTMPTWQQMGQTPSSLEMENMQSPFSHNSSAATTSTGPAFPEFWQIPLTADWEFGNNPWAGLFPAANDYPEVPEPAAELNQSQHDPHYHYYQQQQHHNPAAPSSSLPILSAESFLTDGSTADPDAGSGGGARHHPGDDDRFGMEYLRYAFGTTSQEDQDRSHDLEQGQQSQEEGQEWTPGFLGLF